MTNTADAACRDRAHEFGDSVLIKRESGRARN
jgi:hypothetical protein